MVGGTTQGRLAQQVVCCTTVKISGDEAVHKCQHIDNDNKCCVYKPTDQTLHVYTGRRAKGEGTSWFAQRWGDLIPVTNIFSKHDCNLFEGHEKSKNVPEENAGLH